MPKQFNVNTLKETEAKKYKEFIKLDLEVQGETYEIKIFPYFSPIKINNLLNQMIAFFRDISEENEKIKDDKKKFEFPSDEFDDLIGYFILRTFTNIKTTTSKKYKTLYEEFKLCRNSTLFELVVKSVAEESLERLYSKIYETIELAAKFETKIKMAQQQIEGLKLNPEVLNEKRIPEV